MPPSPSCENCSRDDLEYRYETPAVETGSRSRGSIVADSSVGHRFQDPLQVPSFLFHMGVDDANPSGQHEPGDEIEDLAEDWPRQTKLQRGSQSCPTRSAVETKLASIETTLIPQEVIRLDERSTNREPVAASMEHLFHNQLSAHVETAAADETAAQVGGVPGTVVVGQTAQPPPHPRRWHVNIEDVLQDDQGKAPTAIAGGMHR